MTNTYKDYFEKAQKTKGVVALRRPAALSRRKKAEPPKNGQKKNMVPIICTLILFFLALAGSFYVDEIESLLRRVEFGFMPMAAAESSAPEAAKEAGKDGGKEAGKAEKKGDDKQASGETGKAVAESTDDIELDHFARLRERKTALDKREEDLNKMESELTLQRAEIEKKLKELEDVRKKISTVLEDKVQADEQKVDNLVQFYSNMKAPQAAKIIETIDEDLAVQVIAKMKKKNAAEIMNLLKPEKAQAISERYVGYRK